MLAAVTFAAPAFALAPPGALRLDRGRVTIIHYPGDATLAAAALAAAVSRDSFPWLPRATTHVVIMIAPDAAVFREWAGQAAFPWTAALTFVAQHRVVMQGHRAPGDVGDPLQVLRHELAHVALYDYIGTMAPRWFEEGYASYAAGEERNQGFLATNGALLFRRMPSLAALDTLLASPSGNEARAGYALSLRAVSTLAAIDRVHGLAPLLEAWKARGSFDLAMRRAYAQTAENFEAGWQQETRWGFAFLAVAADSALGGIVLVLLLVPLYRMRRRERRQQLAEMRQREAIAEGLARSAVLDSLVRSIGPLRTPPGSDA